MKTIKTMIVASAAIASVFMSGCDKELPTPEKINSVAMIVGRTAGYACEMAKMNKEVKESIVNTLDIVSTVVPTNGETFAKVWMPIAEAELKKLVDAGKLNDIGVAAAKIAVSAAAEGVDYVFVKYPKAKDVKELVSATIDGFVTGFKSTVAMSAATKVDVDEDALKYIKDKLSAAK